MERLTAIFLFFGVLGIAAVVVKVLLRGQQRVDHARRIWKLVAERLDARVEESSGLLSAGPGIRIVAPLQGASVTVEAERETPGRQRAPLLLTRVRADVVGTCGLRLEVVAEGLMESLGKALGGQDVVIGDEPFDDRYVIKASNEDLARAWLTESIRRGIEGCDSYVFSIADGEVLATRVGLEEDAKRLEAVIRQVAALSRGGRAQLLAVRTMAAEVGGLLSVRGDCWEPDGGVLIVLERPSTQVLVDFTCSPVSGAERVLTRVRARSLLGTEGRFVIHGRPTCDPPIELAQLPLAGHDDSIFSQCFTLMTNDAEGLSERLSPTLRQRLRGLSPALVTGDGREVTVLLIGLVTEPQPILEAIDLAVELAMTKPRGLYR